MAVTDRGHLGIALAVALAGLAILTVVGRAPVASPGHVSAAQIVFSSSPPTGRFANPISVHQYGVWVEANDRFAAAAHAFGKALGSCRMRLGSFGACALPAATSMAYEERGAAAVAATFRRHPGACGRALEGYRARLGAYMAAATALVNLPHGNPMSALGSLEGSLQTAHLGWNEAALRVRGDCRPG